MRAPGWYPDPTGKRRKMFWDGAEWHTKVPASRKHFDPKLMKKLTAIAGVTAMVAVGLAALIATLVSRDSGEAQEEAAAPAPAAGAPSPTTTTPKFLTVKTMPNDGMYMVGGDQVDPGVWESDGPTEPGGAGCEWARLSAPQDTEENKIEVGTSESGSTQVRIEPTDAAFATRGCQVWRMIAP